MRRNFREETGRNRRKLLVFLGSYFLLALFVGRMLAAAFQVHLDPEGHYGMEPASTFFKSYANKLALAVLLLAWVEYRRIRRRGDKVILAMADARPLQEARARNVSQEMAVAAGLKAPQLWIVEDRVPNAFACGMGEDRSSIAVTRGLLDLLDRDELQAVVAHEMAHIRNGDTKLMTVLLGLTRTFHMAAWLVLGPLWTIYEGAKARGMILRPGQKLVLPELKESRPLSRRAQVTLILCMPLIVVVGLAVAVGLSLSILWGFSLIVRYLPWIIAGFAIFELIRDRLPVPRKEAKLRRILMLTPCGIAAGPAILVVGLLVPLLHVFLRLAVSRNREFQADATAVELTRNPWALCNALEKLAAAPQGLASGLNMVTIVPTVERIFSTHPPIEERIRRIEMMASDQAGEMELPPSVRFERAVLERRD